MNVIETSLHWRHCLWRHRHRRLTVVISVIAVVVTILFIDTKTRRFTYDQPSVEIHRSSVHPSVSSSLLSSSSSSSSSRSSSSLSSFFSIFLAHQLLKHKTPSPGIQRTSISSSSSSSSEPQPRSTSGAWSRSSSSLPPSLQVLDAQFIKDMRHVAFAKQSIKYFNCTPDQSTPTPSPPYPAAEEQPSSQSWQRMEVPGSRRQSPVSYLFSAYYDPRSRPPRVLILGLTSNFYQFFADSPSEIMVDAKYFCQFRYRNSSTYDATTALFSFATETHGRRLAMTYTVT